MAPQREWFEKDYYAVLGVSQQATAKEITKEYRRLARQHHPDANAGNEKSEERFKEISAAYDVLGDEKKRTEYDEVRRLGPSAGFGGSGASPFNFDMGDGFGDAISQMFGRSKRGGRTTGPQRGTDIEASLTLDFVDAVRGITTTLHLTADAVCSTCTGSGARVGTMPKACGQCGGRGSVDDNQGLFSFSSPCPSCRGRGSVIEYPCATCRGTGIEHRPREVNLRIPAGVSDGQRIRLKGRGAPGRNSGPAGDLYVECHVTAHALFGREGLNLTTHVRVSYTEAVLGATVPVSTLDGAAVSLRLKAGTTSGSRHRVKGHGILTEKKTGDLIVTVNVVVPTDLSDEERSAVEALHAVLRSPRQSTESAGTQ
ncbi:MAG: molecular chaperone DnaJ [Ilumatobacteraceae bacterium]|nr:molecular chaperone DnaJ [Ilumatobacteraceae bacterium]